MRLRTTGSAAFAALLLAVPAAHAGTNSIYPVAGTGTAGSLGDGDLATLAQLNDPGGTAVVSSGPYKGILIADAVNNRVRRVAPNGNISTVAGTGVAGFSGDNGAATSAQLAFPTDVDALPGGAFLIADNTNHVVRRVSTAGVITRVAGTGVAGYSGDGGPAVNAQVQPLSI
ncbi:MAG: hypothetical protein QOF76_5465, partial [Solirubrobacteraceae bacterium]|nr:hypothetical protein [Solirubrobacteraceae bacterium]